MDAIMRLSHLLKTVDCDQRDELIELVIGYGRAMQEQGFRQAANQVAIIMEAGTVRQIGA